MKRSSLIVLWMLAAFCLSPSVHGVTLVTNQTFAYIVASTPYSDVRRSESVTNWSSASTVTFSNRVSVTDAFGSAEASLMFTNVTTVADDQLRSMKLTAAATSAAQGASSIPDREYGAGSEAGIFYSVIFSTTNQTIVDIKSSGQIRLYYPVTNSATALTNLYTSYVAIDLAPIKPLLDYSFDRIVNLTDQLRTQRVSFPAGQHRIEAHFFEGSVIDSFMGFPDSPSGTSRLNLEITFAINTNIVRWTNTAGGSYFRNSNWHPARIPEKSDDRADVALFDLPGLYEIDSSASAPQSLSPSSQNRASAERWVLQGGEVRNFGGARLASLDPESPSLSIGQGSRLNLQSGTLRSVHSRIGDGGTNLSEIWIMGAQSLWTNSGFIYVGEYSPGQILAFDSKLQTEEVRLGMGHPGEAYLRGRQAQWEAGNVAIGYQNSTGKISLEDGAYMQTKGLYLGYEQGSRGELVVTGRSSERASSYLSLGTNVIGRLGPAEVKALDGGAILLNGVVELSAFQPSVNRSRPARLIAQGVNASGDKSYIFSGAEVFVGGGGSIEALDGGQIDFDQGWIGLPGGGDIKAFGVHTPTRQRSLIHFADGLIIGWTFDAYSTLIVTNGARVLAEGDVSFGGASEYFVAIHTEKDGYYAELDVTDPVMEIGSGQITVLDGGVFRTKSAILAGNDDMPAYVAIVSDSIFPGWIAVGDIRVGSPQGPAEIALSSGGIVSCTGTVATYPGKGRITGTGTIRTLTLTNSGNFNSGSSPGSITIEGDFVQTETGKMEIEITGTDAGRFDTVNITGKADIGGTIEYVFNDYFIPAVGDKFSALQISGPTTKTARETFRGTPLGVASMQTRITNGVLEVTGLVSTNYNALQQFGPASEGATNGWGPLVLATDGRIYGCIRNGGQFGGGAIFSVRPEGHEFQILRHFNPTNDGAQPLGGIMQARNGRLFGTCSIGGTNNVGTLWQMELGGAKFKVLRHFGSFDDLKNPSAELMQHSNGFLYGTAQTGGFDNRGGIFRVNPDTGGNSILVGFSAQTFGSPNGPVGGLVEGPDGRLYGTSERGGSADNGAVFVMTPNGATTNIASLGTAQGGLRFPTCTLLLDEDGMLYGTTYSGGTSNFGGIFAVRTNGTNFRIVKNMGVTATEGREPRVGLVEAPDGTLLGTTRIGGPNNQGTVFRLRKDGTQLANTVVFGLQNNGGARSRSPLLQAVGGVFYGMTFGGGAADHGVLFRLFTPALIPGPAILTEPRSVIEAPGSTITLSATASANQRLQYQWTRNGTNVPGAFSPTLTLPRADAAAVGEYKVRIAGLTGEIQSQPVQVSLFSVTTNRDLLIQGAPGKTYRIEATQSLTTNTVWVGVTNVLLNGSSALVPIGNTTNTARFFRATHTGL